jgi:hypothetical protein
MEAQDVRYSAGGGLSRCSAEPGLPQPQGGENRMSEIPDAAHALVDAELTAAVDELRAVPRNPESALSCEVALCAAATASKFVRSERDPQALASMFGTLDEALRGVSGNTRNDARIHAALSRLETAKQILAPHVETRPDSACIACAAGLLRELHQVLGDLHVRLFIDAATRDSVAPLVQLARDDASLLRQQFEYAGKFGDPWNTRHVMTRIQAELLALSVPDERSKRALSDGRQLIAEILALVGAANPGH